VAFGTTILGVTGFPPIVYRNLYQMQPPYLTSAEEQILLWPWWLARYAAVPGVSGWMFWQKTMSARVPGISALVDLSDYTGTQDGLAAWQNQPS
jgi:GH25 family lysozyme M1 (1,4-beta-N-acetylmuramidase)